MTRIKYSELETIFFAEINRQMQNLHLLTDFYCQGAGAQLLSQIPAGGKLLFISEGDHIFLAQWAARQCAYAGIDAQIAEPGELVKWPTSLVEKHDLLILLSTDPIDQITLPKNSLSRIISIGNLPDERSPHSEISLPAFISKDQQENDPLNTGVLLWLLCRQLSNGLDGNESEMLKHLRQRMQLLLEGHLAVQEQWQRCLYGMDRLALVGCGSQSLAVVQTSTALSAWAGQQSSSFFSLSALSAASSWIGPGWGVIIFDTSKGSGKDSPPEVARLMEQGTDCIRVIGGFPLPFLEQQTQKSDLPPELSAFVNSLSGKIFALKFEV